MTKEQATALSDKINQQIAKKGNMLTVHSGSIYDCAFPILIGAEYLIIMRRSDTMVGDYRLVPLTWLRFSDGEEIDLTALD